jgi:predicted component of type VI protein secretion system
VFRPKYDIHYFLIKFHETQLKLTEVFLQVRRDIQEILHLFRPHLHSHEVQVEVSTRNCDQDIDYKRTAVSMINLSQHAECLLEFPEQLWLVWGIRFTISIVSVCGPL